MAKKLKILATAKQSGSVNVIAPVVRELILRGHDVTAYATGNENEAAGFRGISHQIIQPKESDYSSLVKGFDLMLVGLSGYQTPDGYFLRAANKSKIPTIAIQDQDAGYIARLGNNPEEFPSILAVMDNGCLETIVNELGEAGKELASRTKVTGWVAFDNYAELRENFNSRKREELLRKISLDPEKRVYVHFTQNIHPDSEYMKPQTWTPEEKEQDFGYEMRVTEAVFRAASDMRLKLVVKPHPGEAFEVNYTENIANRFGFKYIPPKACDTKLLMLSVASVSAGRSTYLTEACLLDINTGGILPGLNTQEICAFPPVKLDAIPYTRHWNEIARILSLINFSGEDTNKYLAERRKRFSVDGKATQRLVDVIENQ